MKLENRVIEFSNKILSGRSLHLVESVETCQKNFLFAMANGAFKTAKSYYELVKSGELSQLNILARVSLERYLKSVLAHKEAKNAVALLIAEDKEHIKRLKLCDSEHFADIIKIREESVMALNEMSGDRSHTEFDSTFKIFEKCELGRLYRNVYFNLCNHAHGSFFVSAAEEEASTYSHFIIQIAAVDIANMLYRLDSGSSHSGYDDLKASICSQNDDMMKEYLES